MAQAKPRRPYVRGDEASVSDRGIARKLFQDQICRNALADIHARIVESSHHRPLTRLEVRIRCIAAPRPWRDLGIDRSTFYRRRQRMHISARTAGVA